MQVKQNCSFFFLKGEMEAFFRLQKAEIVIYRYH